jgi:hypothetical protein
LTAKAGESGGGRSILLVGEAATVAADATSKKYVEEVAAKEAVMKKKPTDVTAAKKIAADKAVAGKATTDKATPNNAVADIGYNNNLVSHSLFKAMGTTHWVLN